jgi:hypothetical protein
VDCRAAFTQCYNRWNRSGQNCPESFHDFVPHHSGCISTIGKSILVFHAALRVGKPVEVSDFLTFTLRTIPGEISMDTMQMIDGSNKTNTDNANLRQSTPRKRSQ